MSPCHWVDIPGGGRALVTVGRGRRKRCYVAGCRSLEGGAFQCDWPIAEGKVCDRYCCRAHAKRVGEDRDYCVEHALQAARK